MKVIHLPIVTDSNGIATVMASESVNGALWAVAVDIGDGATALPNTTDITLSVVNGALNTTLLTLTDVAADAVLYPRGNSCGATGIVSTDGLILLPVIGVLKVVVAQGGDVQTGSLTVYVLE